MIEAAIKVLMALWPFVQEMFFHGRSLKQVIFANKLVFALLVVLGLSLTVNYFSVGKIWSIAVARSEEKKEGMSKPPLGTPPVSTGPGNPASAASAATSSNQVVAKTPEQLEEERLAKERAALKKRLQDIYKD